MTRHYGIPVRRQDVILPPAKVGEAVIIHGGEHGVTVYQTGPIVRHESRGMSTTLKVMIALWVIALAAGASIAWWLPSL